MKVKLRQVDLVFHVRLPGRDRDWSQFTLQVALLHGKVNISFSLPAANADEAQPEALIEGLAEAAAWARRNVRAKDLSELDADARDE